MAIVPLRANAWAKQRLAHVLGPRQRIELVMRCYEHVVEVLCECGLRTITLAPHSVEAPPGVETWLDGGHGLNRALSDALSRAGTPVLIVHADLPWLEAGDVEAVLAAPGHVAVARAHDGGTNGLLLRKLVRPAFGTGSALRHAAAARAAGLRSSVLDLPGFARDLDDEAALSAWTSSWPRRL